MSLVLVRGFELSSYRGGLLLGLFPWSSCRARALCSFSVSLWVVSLLTFPLFLHELKVGSGSPPWGLKPIEAVHGVVGNLPALKVILTLSFLLTTKT